MSGPAIGLSQDANKRSMDVGYSECAEETKRARSADGGMTGSPSSATMDHGREEGVGTSKVLHVRALPVDASESDLVDLAHAFGRVVNVLLLKGKNQGFIQMETPEQATTLLAHCSNAHTTIRGKEVFLQYSNRNEITSSAAQRPPQTEEIPSPILHISILNLIYPITVDILHQIFSKYGFVLKIITFSKNNFHALIQYPDVQTAGTAKAALDGQNIYSGCCTLRIQYSQLKQLTVKFNNDKCRDYQNPTLPSEPAPMPAFQVAGMPDQSYLAGPGGFMPYTGFSPPAEQGGTRVLIMSGFDAERVTPVTLFTLCGVYGDVVRVKILFNKKDTALVMFANASYAQTALMYLNGCPLHGRPLAVNLSKHHSISLPRETDREGQQLTKDFTNSPFHRFKMAGSRNFSHICAPTTMLHVSNISEGVSEEDIVSIFSQSGTVVGFRFFAKDRRMGLVQMASVPESVDALVNTHNYLLNDQHIKVSFSKSKLEGGPMDAPQ